MLRQRVLEGWKSYKQKFLTLKKRISTLGEKSTALPTFPIGLSNCRSKLELWTSYEYLEKLTKVKNEISELEPAEFVADLWFSCSSTIDLFKELTAGWKKEKDSYARYRENNSNSGPTIEEVD